MKTLAMTLTHGCAAFRSTVAVGMTLAANEVCDRLNLVGLARHAFGKPSDEAAFLNIPLNLAGIAGPADLLPTGAHLVSPRGFYLHHGIHLGGGEVIHYSGFSGSFKAGPVEVIGLEHFASGRPVWIVQEPCEFPADQVVSRARSRLGERRYSVLSNNCEHFCSWCIHGKSCSAQVRALLRGPRYLLSLVSALQLYFIA